MKNHNEDWHIDFKVKDKSGKKYDEGSMSIHKCIAYWKKLMKKKDI